MDHQQQLTSCDLLKATGQLQFKAAGMAAKRFRNIRTCGESAQEGPRVRKVLLGCVESPQGSMV